MKQRLIRLVTVLVVLLVMATTAYYLRKAMTSAIRFHSIWHYLVRIVIGISVGFSVILVTRMLSVTNPGEGFGVPSAPKADFKLSNLGKRIADLVTAVTLLTVLFPFLIVVAFAIFILEGYPVFYISQRFIAVDQCVTVLKFRTMVKDATSPKYRLRERYMREGYLDIPLECEVYTPIGRLLERSQIVETLQLFNIMLHGMSLIGNRPLPRDNILLLKQFDGWEKRFNSPAGLTGLSQVVGKMNQSPQGRLELENLYSSLYRKKGANILICDIYVAYYTARFLLFKMPLPMDEAKRIVQIASGEKKVAFV